MRVRLSNGSVLDGDKDDYEGFLTRPLGWEAVAEKLERLADRYVGGDVQAEILEAVRRLDEIDVSDLTEIVARVDTRRGGGVVR